MEPVSQQGQLHYQRKELPKTLTPLDLVLVTLTVTTSQPQEFVMVQDHLPATAQVVRRDRNMELAKAITTTAWAHREFHDEKTVFFFTRLGKGTHRVYYFFRPLLPGQFHALPAEALLMYYPEIRGNSGETIFNVK